TATSSKGMYSGSLPPPMTELRRMGTPNRMGTHGRVRSLMSLQISAPAASHATRSVMYPAYVWPPAMATNGTYKRNDSDGYEIDETSIPCSVMVPPLAVPKLCSAYAKFIVYGLTPWSS